MGKVKVNEREVAFPGETITEKELRDLADINPHERVLDRKGDVVNTKHPVKDGEELIVIGHERRG